MHIYVHDVLEDMLSGHALRIRKTRATGVPPVLISRPGGHRKKGGVKRWEECSGLAATTRPGKTGRLLSFHAHARYIHLDRSVGTARRE